MKRLIIKAELHEPVHLGAKHSTSNFGESLPYISGRSLLGAVAWTQIHSGMDPSSAEFQDWFVSGAVSWGDLFPIGVGSESEVADSPIPLVIPRTAKACKLYGLAHGVADDFLLEASNTAKTCTRCTSGMGRLDDIQTLMIRSGAWTRPKVRTSHRAHVAIAFDTQIARQGHLYSREVLEDGQFFCGDVLCADEPTHERLAERLTSLNITLGRSRTRGFGAATLQVVPGEVQTIDAATLKMQSEAYLASTGNVWYFTLTSVSPWCLRSDCGGYLRTMGAPLLARLLGVPANDAIVIRGSFKTAIRSGWDHGAKLPIESREVIAPGSTFLCCVRGLDCETLAARLNDLGQRGIGHHRVEGYGRVVVNHAIHFQGLSGGGL